MEGARDWLGSVLDPGWTELFDDVVGADPLGFPGYRAQLEQARARTGCSESVVVAEGRIGGNDAVAFSFEFGFLGGSMGAAAGERICRAFERAAGRGVPVVGMVASGGARMQEGMLALAQMPATLLARARLAEAHQPFVCYLRNPTTGGVYASFASSADVLWAEPGATIGFAGPRIAEQVTGLPLSPGSHTAEWAASRGLVSATVRPEDLRARLAEALSRVRVAPADPPDPPEEPRPTVDAWDAVRIARDPARPPPRSYLGAGARTLIGGYDVVAIAAGSPGARLLPGDYRDARRAIATAVRLRVPVVTVVDTLGADPGSASEGDGIAREIAATFQALLAAPVPTVACVTGEGASGGALALAACDRILIQENAFFSVIAPEGAAAILRRTDVEQVARDLRLTAGDLRRLGLADRVIPDPSGSDDAARALHRAVAWAIAEVEREGAPTARRFDRWRAS